MLALGMLLVTLLACLSIRALMSAWRQRKLWGKLPPGPTPLPFIGNYLQLDTEKMYSCLLKISKHYGPVFTIYMGLRRVVVLCGYDIIKEALVDQAEEFNGRGEQATFNSFFNGYGVTFSNGERSKQLRRFSIATLRDFGVGKRGIEERIKEEAGYFVQTIQATHGAFIDPTFYLSKSVSNVMNSIVFGDRFDYEDKEFLSLLQMMTGIKKFVASPQGQLYEMFFSVMKYLPGPQQEIYKDMQNLENYMAKKVEKNQRTLDPNAPRDFIDSFLIRMQQEKKNPNTEFNMKNLVMTTLSLFFAGTETISSTLRFGLLLLLKHPDVEAKIHEEIDQVIGRNRQPQFEDRMKMPYTEAVIHEIQRFANFVPMGVARRITKNTTLRNFFLPKDTEVFPMLGTVLTDYKFFSNPEDFNPQHFLDDKGQFKKSDAFVPFSLGKRNCFGEGLARMELFLFLTIIMQNFWFKSPQAAQDIYVPPQPLGFTRILPNYTISFLPR
ncbi:Cytochrome P450 2A3 [Heterocephalus glaber]|uniref:Cytochrome P450 n=1 Tax=Heterocephalus glaber TaxID=10181 RepID=G5C9W3_HETGA|nr:cytochrome P450 2A3 [Heterocephalus glaber]EHB18324.1 Cytochrome P450 2A3 [Heterocephalus glaber]